MLCICSLECEEMQWNGWKEDVGWEERNNDKSANEEEIKWREVGNQINKLIEIL